MNGSGAAAGLAYLFLLPMLVWAASMFWPLAANADLTRFSGKYFRWRIVHYTGFVLASDTAAHVRTTTTQGYSDSGDPVRRTHSSTTLHSDIRIQLADGALKEIHLVDFGHSCRPGDVLTVWFAKKGRRNVAFAALNMTTDLQYKPGRGDGIGLVIMGHNFLFPILFAITILVSFLAGGTGVFMAFLVLVLVAAGWNLTRRRFLRSGMKPLWAKSKRETEQLQWAAS